MKDINFINPLPPTREHEVRLWLLSSTILIAGLLAMGISLIAVRVWIVLQLKKEIKQTQQKADNFDSLIAKQHTYTQQEQALKKQLSKINHWRTSPHNPHQYLAALRDACSTSIKLESLRINKETVDLTAQCAQPQQATELVKKLSGSSHFADLKLVSLQAGHDTKWLFSVKGTVKIHS